MGTTSTCPPRDKDNLKRGQHGRHQQTKKKVHAIHRLGPKGEPVSPKKVIDTYSNQCACAVKEKVPITYLDWRTVPKEYKDNVWGEVKKRFNFLAEGYNEDRCKSHALAIAGKALRSFRSLLNREYVQTGRTPFEDYNMIKKHVWDEFVELMSTDEAKAKAEKFKELAKRNELPHNLGMTGYAFHIEEWRREEREAAEAGQPSPLMSINERSQNYLYARRPKK
jgi:hypothetical protein